MSVGAGRPHVRRDMTDQTPPQVGAPIGFVEFVSLVAALLVSSVCLMAALPIVPVA